jgi:ABC-type polysaccharide/polyol phosphate transport system ATPase subunit
MTDVALSARAVSKSYRIYRSRPFGVMEFLGLSIGSNASRFREYLAIDNLSIDIARGTTVGVIGSNGAGKSTLLRLLAGVSEPTSGQIIRMGSISPLLELGTGFHPDLTGHENIFASGLYLGLDRSAMESLYADIAAFADIGDFLHQPVRTYSTGMYMRLAFAVATSIQSDIQVIDEVLGVGDAYFFGKCLQRFRALQEAGRTSIVVSHDHSAIIRLCSRCIWLDHGRVVADGAPLDVVTLYSRSAAGRLNMRKAKGRATHEIQVSGACAIQPMNGIAIDAVEFMNGDGRVVQSVGMGQPLTIRTRYNSDARLEHAVLAVVIHRADGLTVCNAISSMDDVYFDLVEGSGTIDLMFDGLLLGPGEYSVVVGIYPTLDLGDSARTQHVAVWREPKTLFVAPPLGIVMDLGVVRHPVRWSSIGRTETSVQSAAPSCHT